MAMVLMSHSISDVISAKKEKKCQLYIQTKLPFITPKEKEGWFSLGLPSLFR